MCGQMVAWVGWSSSRRPGSSQTQCTGQAALATGVAGQNGWNWAANRGTGSGGTEYGPATVAKPGCVKGKEYQVPEYYEYEGCFFYDLLQQISRLDRRQEQPSSNLDPYWGGQYQSRIERN